MQSVEDDSPSQTSEKRIAFDRLRLLTLPNPKGFPNIVWNNVVEAHCHVTGSTSRERLMSNLRGI